MLNKNDVPRMINKIKNWNQVERVFGLNMHFHDDEITEFKLTSNSPHEAYLTLSVSLVTIGHEKKMRVKMIFFKVENIKIESSNDYPNIVSELQVFDQINSLEVVFSPCQGLWTEFTCASAEVLSVEKI